MSIGRVHLGQSAPPPSDSSGNSLLTHAVAQGLGLELISWNVEFTSSAADGLGIYENVRRFQDRRFGDRLYLFAVSEEDLMFFWTDEDGGAGVEPWNVTATGVNDADCWFLDASFNDGYWLGSTYNPIVAYQSDWDLFLWRYHGTTGAEHFLFDAALPVFERPGGIAASHDELEAVYWSYSYETKACSSSSAGSSPVCAAWGGCDQDFASDVAVASGGVFGAAYAPDNGECLYRARDALGNWSGAAVCHDSRPSLTGPLSLAPISPFGPFSLGIVAVDDDPDDNTPYFFPAQVVLIDGFEIGNVSAWSSANLAAPGSVRARRITPVPGSSVADVVLRRPPLRTRGTATAP